MNGEDFYAELAKNFQKLLEENHLLDDEICISGHALSSEEAIGNPQRRDYPLLKGKEKLMQAEFKGALGQAFTDMPGSFQGRLKEVIDKTPQNNFEVAVLIASMNAVLKHLGLAEKTVHCKNDEPEICAERLVEYIKNKYEQPRIAMVGLQPAMLEKLSRFFTVRAVDLDKDNIGQTKSGVLIEGPERTGEIIEWCELIVATGSTVANGTMPMFLVEKPVIFFGTTCAAAACLMGLERFCYMAS